MAKGYPEMVVRFNRQQMGQMGVVDFMATSGNATQFAVVFGGSIDSDLPTIPGWWLGTFCIFRYIYIYICGRDLWGLFRSLA